MAFHLVLDNVRSSYNVGAIWRTAEAAGVSQLWLCGITPHPPVDQDSRLPYVAAKAGAAIAKTALGAEKSLPFNFCPTTLDCLRDLKSQGCVIYGLEQSPQAKDLFEFRPSFPLALVVGNEPKGLSPAVLAACDQLLEIPMRGQKDSLNVSVATGIALYQLGKYLS